jgi:hypothetical protein
MFCNKSVAIRMPMIIKKTPQIKRMTPKCFFILLNNRREEFMVKEVKNKGRPIPREKDVSMKKPCNTVSVWVAYNKTPARIGPTQGDHPRAKTIPIINDPKNPGGREVTSASHFLSSMGSFINFIRQNPRAMMSNPPNTRITSRYASKNLPSMLALMPSDIKTKEKPKTKKTE